MNLHNVKITISAVKPSQFIHDGRAQFVFVGRSNVGKSSLINRLLGRRNFARTSSTPGKTATINYYDLDSAIYLVDLPGYGYARVSKEERKVWGRFIDDYFALTKDIALVFCLIDIRHPPTPDDRVMVEYLRHTGLPFAVIATKADKLSKAAAAASAQGISESLGLSGVSDVIVFSAKTGQGRDQILSLLTPAEEI